MRRGLPCNCCVERTCTTIESAPHVSERHDGCIEAKWRVNLKQFSNEQMRHGYQSIRPPFLIGGGNGPFPGSPGMRRWETQWIRSNCKHTSRPPGCRLGQSCLLFAHLQLDCLRLPVSHKVLLLLERRFGCGATRNSSGGRQHASSEGCRAHVPLLSSVEPVSLRTRATSSAAKRQPYPATPGCCRPTSRPCKYHSGTRHSRIYA